MEESSITLIDSIILLQEGKPLIAVAESTESED
jgi:hypothetical protein